MRTLPLLLTTLALAAPAPAQEEGETIRDGKSGLVIRVPEQWSRETAREKGSIKFSGMYDLNSTKYVLFQVETGPSANFVEATWLATEKAGAAKFLQTTDVAWTTEPVMVGGIRAERYTIGGKTEKGEDLRIRGCGLVSNDVFFRIVEVSHGRAHEEAADAIKSMWEAIKFEEANPFAQDDEEGCGEEEKPAGEGETAKEGGEEGSEPAPQGEPLVIEDKAGGYKVSAMPGWSMERAPMEDGEAQLRLVVKRGLADGSEAGAFEVWRFRAPKADIFETEEPGDVLVKVINGEIDLFDDIYEQGASKVLRPEVDARTHLGGADKSCGYSIKGLRLSEEAKIEEAQTLIRRGDTSVKVPEYEPIFVRGRLAMISPYIYVTRSYLRRGAPDAEKLFEEITRMEDSLTFGSTEGKPPPLRVGDAALGNTLADPANKAERKKSKVHEYKKGVKVAAALKIDYVLPPGFQDVETVHDADAQTAYGGEDTAVLVAAQDENNGWVFISMAAASAKRLGSNEKFTEKKEIFDGWIHNFESLARNAGRMPKKPADVKIGNLSGDGCELDGNISGFSATETHLVTDESGWRIEITIKTRGTGAKTFAEAIKTFRKKFRASKK